MNENIKFITKLISKSAISFLKINLLGQLLIISIAIATIIMIINQTFEIGADGESADVKGFATIVFLFSSRPVSFSLAVLSAIICPILLFSLGNKYIILKAINRIISHKGENILFPIIDKVVNTIKSKQPELFQKGADKMKLQLKLFQEIKDSNDNKWLKKIMIYALNKIDLNTVDFKDESVSLSEIIKNKIIDSLKNVSKPNRNFFWIIIGFQVTLLVLISIRLI